LEPQTNFAQLHDELIGPNQSKNNNQDVSKAIEWHERARNDVDVPALREGILHRARDLKESSQLKQTACLTTKRPKTSADRERENKFLDKAKVEGLGMDLEDQDIQEAVDDGNDANGSVVKTRRSKQSIAFQPLSNDHEREAEVLSNYNNFSLPVAQSERHARKEGENANEHFYRILDEILGNAREEAANKIITEQMAQPAGMKLGISQSLRQNRSGNSTIKDRLNEIRMELRANTNNVTTTATKKNVSTGLNKAGTKIFLVVSSVAFFIIIFWFLFGCYGMYVYFHPSAASVSQHLTVSKSDNAGVATSPQDIVIRIMKEIVYVDQDGKEVRREPWTQYEGKNAQIDTRRDYEKIAECIAQ
jgi:hypothetical protein